MPCFSPTRGDLSPPSSLRPFAFKVSALRRCSFSWPCKFIPSMPRLSACSKWYFACLDGMRLYPVEGLASAPSPRRTCRPRVRALGLQPPQRVGGAEVAWRWPPPLVRLPSAKVVASAGKLSVQRWSPPLASRSEQRWSPPLVRLPGASFQRGSTDAE
jgi:hypothetical protein